MTTKTRRPRALVRLTKTYGPFPKEGTKYRKTFSGQECCHRWSGNEYPEGKAGNIHFHDGVIYSYGSHFPMARHVRSKKTGQVGIFYTSKVYSSSTAKHLSYVRRSIPYKTIIFTVPDVLADSRGDHLANLKHFQDEALWFYRRSKRARENKGYFLRSVVATIRAGNAYAEFVGLTERIGPPTDGDLVSWEEKALEEARIAQEKANRIREKRDAEARKQWEEREKQEEARLKRQIDEYQKKLADWQAGTRIENPGDHPLRHRWNSGIGDFVRVSRDKYLQTTAGMSVPLKDVLPILAAIRKGRTGTDEFTEGFRVQEYDGTVYWEDKVVKVGCHCIAFSEIERAASAAGL